MHDCNNNDNARFPSVIGRLSYLKYEVAGIIAAAQRSNEMGEGE